ncbi:hypothetical protein GCM10028805_21600 [Spirosoma harenae]
MTEQPSKPTSVPLGTPDYAFQRIALCLSGGGFRASAYSLGTLNALYLLGLLDNVHMLSTASGGTITGAYYALWRKRGRSFETIYTKFYNLLQEDKLLPEALKQWEQSIGKDKTNFKLIQAFADIYDRDLYEHIKFGEFWKADPDPAKPFHLQSIIFGATELYSGLTFRFQHAAFLPETTTDAKGEVRTSFFVGNNNVRIRNELAQELRIADTVAASSCFPAGFEPLVMPDDFFPSDAIQPVLLDADNKPIGKDRVALVDGGVYDNQGIESLLTANRRNREYRKTTAFTQNTPQEQALLGASSLLLIADVDSAGKDLYETPKPGPTRGDSSSIGTLGKFLTIAQWVLVAVFVLAISQRGYRGSGSFGAGLLTGLSAVGILLTLGIRWGWNKLIGYSKLLGLETYRLASPAFLGLSPKQLIYLLRIRLSSVGTLLLSVFLRRVRSLDYGLVFGKDNGLSSEIVVIPSIIGGIVREYNSPISDRTPASSVRRQLLPVYETVLTASEMSTTLWWLEDKRRMNPIIASAELTLCYRLLRQFERRPPSGEAGKELLRRATLIWEAYQKGGLGFRLHPGLLSDLEDKNCTVAQLIGRANALAAK